MLVQAQSSLEHVLHARLVPDVIFADALQLPCRPAVDPAVADMRQGEASPAQHQGAEGGQQRLAAAVSAQPAVLRQQQAVQGLGHAPGGRRGVVVQGQRLQARPRRQATVGALADTIGESEQVAFAGGQFRVGGHQAQGVLVFLPGAAGAGLGKAQLQVHGVILRPAPRSPPPNPRWCASAA
ncbi:hypothetical protein D3C81_915100 [compost metagenome]